jgi:maleylpyruvate isomerase
MKLYDADISSAASRVRIALALKHLEAERVPVAILGPGAGNRAADYLRVNPQGLVPALQTEGGSLVTQSLAIVEYLDEIEPARPLLPIDPEARAFVRSIALAVAAEIHALLTPRVAAFLRTLSGAGDATVAAWKRHWLEEGLDALEALLARRPGDGPCCLGDSPTLADVFLFPQAVNAERAGLELARWPAVAAVVTHLRTLPSFVDNAPALPR